MDSVKKRMLENAGVAVGDAADFLALSPEEIEQVNARETREVVFVGAKKKYGESV